MDWQQFQADYLASFQSIKESSIASRCHLVFEAEQSFFFDLCPIQDPFLFRSRYFGLQLARYLIDEKGNLQKDVLGGVLNELEKGFFSLGPKRESDAIVYEHVKDCLKALDVDPEVWNWIRKLSPPLCHKQAEEVIRQTLWPESIRVLQPVHVRRAACAAWLTPLRQTTGSCFATAPAILIQKKPHLFFKDLYELLGMGQIRRIIDGKQYAAPLYPSIQNVELRKPFPKGVPLFFSPGLLAALTETKLLPKQESIGNKARRLETALKELNPKNAEELLRLLTLQGLGLTEEDVAEEEALSQIQMQPIAAKEGAVFYQKPSLRAQKVADWKKQLKAATRAFQAMTECALLRIWEYTLASFSDVKTDFAKWNLYLGLGMLKEQAGGIATFLYERIEEHLKAANEKTLRLQEYYESAVQSVRALEVLLQEAGDIRRLELQGQLGAAIHEAQLAFDALDRNIKRAKAISECFVVLLQSYDNKFQEYFQEIFEPSVSQMEGHLFEDSPAGFRLLYKHGRADASLWEWIYDEDTYIRSLRSFFASVEGEIDTSPSLGKEFISAITTELIQFIQTPPFLEGAKRRSQASGKRSPWEYISGGTMQSLVQAYHSRSEPLIERTFLPHSAMELLHILEEEKKKGTKILLVHSPVHAFVLRLDLFPENAAEKIEINRAQIQNVHLEEEAREFILHSLSEKLLLSERDLFLHLFQRKGTATTHVEFREALIETLKEVERDSSAVERVDSHLYENAFLVSKEKLKQTLLSIVKPWENGVVKEAISKIHAQSMGLSMLHQTAKSILLKSFQAPFVSMDLDAQIALQLQRLELAPPHLILFADTNWSGWFFGFIVNPATKETELWRLNRIGTHGYPMNEWKRWFSSKNTTPWIFLSKSEEYS